MSPAPGTYIYMQDRAPEQAPRADADYDYESEFAGTETGLVIDNGATELRAGWTTDQSPRLRCENIVARYRERKAQKPILLAGAECYADATSKTNLKTPFDGDLLCNSDAMVRFLCTLVNLLFSFLINLPCSTLIGAHAGLCVSSFEHHWRSHYPPSRHDRIGL